MDNKKLLKMIKDRTRYYIDKINRAQKMQLLNDYKALAKLGGGKSKKVSKRPSKRTTKKQSGK
jgi:hypothetical protein